MATVNPEEILKDIEELYRKIEQCNRSIVDYQTNIRTEEASKLDLELLIKDEERRKKAGKRVHYDVPSLSENIERCNKNIELFNDKIVEENNTIKKFRYIIETLREDMKRPNEIIIDLRQNRQRT